MNYAILSDIHGNSEALKSVLEDADPYDIDEYILLGDFFDAGPEPVETFEIIMELRYTAVVGNHDNDLLLYRDGKKSEWDDHCLYKSMLWTYNNMSPNMLSFLRNLPVEVRKEASEKQKYFATHASPGNIYLSLPEEKRAWDDLLSTLIENIFICGHTHRSVLHQSSPDKRFINPGSVGQSHTTMAEYMLLFVDEDDVRVIPRQVRYDISKVRQSFHRKGLLAEGGICAQMNYATIQTGLNYFTPFKRFAKEFAEKHDYHDEISDDVMLKAFDIWDWAVS